MSLRSCNQRLATVWLVAFAIALGLMALHLANQRFGDDAAEAFGWFFPLLLPTLGLISSVFASNAFDDKLSQRQVDPFFYRIAMAVSLIYLASIILVLFLLPWALDWERADSGLTWLQQWALFLGPLQGFVVGVIGFLFVRSKEATM